MGLLARWRERLEGRRAPRSETHGNTLTPEEREFWKQDRSRVDLNRNVVPLGDADDATSVLFDLTLRGKLVHLHQTAPDHWVVQLNDDDRVWHGRTEITALTKALRDVENDDKDEKEMG